MDLYDDPGNPEVTAMLEVPGTKADQLSLRIEDGRLIVEGERVCPRLHASNPDTRDANSAPEPRADATAESAPATLYPTRELKYGKFRREINLPPGVNVSRPSVRLIDPPEVDVSLHGTGHSCPQHARRGHADYHLAA